MRLDMLDAVQRPNTMPTICTLFDHGTLEHCCCLGRLETHPLILDSKLSQNEFLLKPAICQALHLACPETQDTFINNCWTTNEPNGALAYANLRKCGSKR